jgi:hypothetical protein
MAKSPEELAHQEWLGYVQPVGLVVSIPAMLEAQCYVNKNIMAEHARFLSCLLLGKGDEPLPELCDLRELTQKVLGWEPEDLREIPARVPLTGDMVTLEVVLPQYNETLRPTHAVPVFKPAEGQRPWIILIQELAAGCDLDEPDEADSARHWNAAPQAKFERLLRETGVPVGLLSNRRQLRLVYAPKGESSGHATFNVWEMMQVAGRPMFAALHMLLCADRMFSLGDNQRLPAILLNSRKYQNTVSTKLAEQVLAALYELMRGFQAANDVRNGDLLRDVLATDPNHVYAGLLRVLMRLVFVMYAEDRNLLSSDPIYSNYYSVTGLFNRLREDAGRHPDTMNQRYGAWSQLITLFRLIYEGGQHGDFKLPARKGYLFDPDRYPFLEGIGASSQRLVVSEAIALPTVSPIPTTNNQPLTTHPIPRVSDGVIYKVLRNLLILDGERLSYRSLDVEQIGSVYETVMGFNLEVAKGRSIAIKPVKSHGAPATINLSELLKTPGKDRAKWLKDLSDQTLGKEAAKQLKDAESIEQLLEALDKKIAKKVTPRTVPKGAIVLQPSDERRRSGSHYTPRSLTEPIVGTTLEPILKQLCDPQAPLPELYQPSKEDKRRYTHGELDARIRQSERAIEYAKQARTVGTPHPSQILELKICDPAMGSGAFLVEACRQLADHLVESWAAHSETLIPSPQSLIPPDEDEVLYARRQVAQRCLYGVDKNEMAVDLAKLSLWLVTLAKDHPFTFLDHSLRHGDSLVGLTRRQIIGFHWEPKKQKQFGEDLIQKRLDRATEARAKILTARDDVPYRDQETRLALADEALSVIRLTGDACVSAFFAGKKEKERENICEELFLDVASHYRTLQENKFDVKTVRRITNAAASLRTGANPIPAFHWDIEFPEVFSRANGGFDVLLGNPPFLGGSKISTAYGKSCADWLSTAFAPAQGKSDLVAYFFRKAFDVIRERGTFGLISTNTICQGDTRFTGLRWIRTQGGTIYEADRRRGWPGVAAVVVSVVHVAKNLSLRSVTLDGRQVQQITAYLFHFGPDANPHVLKRNVGFAHSGTNINGKGFILSFNERATFLALESKNSQRIRPYLGAEEMNESPTAGHRRFAIYLHDLSENEAKEWKSLYDHLSETVRGQRQSSAEKRLREQWWTYSRPADALYEAINGMSEVLASGRAGGHICFAFQPTSTIFSDSLTLFVFSNHFGFAVLQSRVHEVWARLLGSSLKDDLRYIPESCFETFPFPPDVLSPLDTPSVLLTDLDAMGQEYYVYRAKLMVESNEGLTQTYNRFHDPHEKSMKILKLRELHEAMDRVVLGAYGWHDLARSTRCEFLLDYEEDEVDSDVKKSKKKKPWRLRWPEDFRDEVLARLLELNEQRHQEEQLAGKQAAKPVKLAKSANVSQPKKPSKAKGGDLFPQSLEPRHRHLLMLLRAWNGRAVTRRVLNAGLILMLDDKLRASLLSDGKRQAGKRKAVPDLNQIFTELEIDGFIQQVASEQQQLWRITSTAPATADASPADVSRVTETMQYLNRAQEVGTIKVSEEIVDAEVDLIPA